MIYRCSIGMEMEHPRLLCNTGHQPSVYIVNQRMGQFPTPKRSYYYYMWEVLVGMFLIMFV